MKFHNNGDMYVYVYIQLTCYKYIRNMQTCKKREQRKCYIPGQGLGWREGERERLLGTFI